jgi:hypothetical protein
MLVLLPPTMIDRFGIADFKGRLIGFMACPRSVTAMA